MEESVVPVKIVGGRGERKKGKVKHTKNHARETDGCRGGVGGFFIKKTRRSLNKYFPVIGGRAERSHRLLTGVFKKKKWFVE